MVISYRGALNAFLAIWNFLPGPIRLFIQAVLLITGGVALFNKVLGWD